MLLTLVAASIVLHAQIIEEKLSVHQDARVFPNGYTTHERIITIDRPDPGTYLQGVVIVKTRDAHGYHNGERLIRGSSSSAILEDAGAVAVKSAFDVPKRSKSQEEAQVEDITGLNRIYQVSYTQDIDPYDLALELMKSPDVEYAEPVQIHETYLTPNDPRYGDQVWLQSLRLEGAWDVSIGAATVQIAIIDSGTDWQHEDLASQIWTNPGEIPDNGQDDDGNGFIDDVRGWDFVGNVSTIQAVQGQFLPDNDPRVDWPTINNRNGHGTIVAGCASARTNNNTGIAAPGYNCKIIPIKCGIDNASGQGIFAGYNAIRYAADLGAEIINCSWGGAGSSAAAQDVIDYATAQGSLVIAASGNNGVNGDLIPHNPANLEGAMSVGSVSNAGNPSGFSNYGWVTHTYAPGQNILSTAHGDRYSRASGTSFSCPLVAGIAGLVAAEHPDWTPEMIKEHLRSTSDALPPNFVDPDERGNYYGMANAFRALTENKSFTSGKQTPGIVLRDVSVVGGQAITNYEPTEVEFTFHNILGGTDNVGARMTIYTAGVSLDPAAAVTIGDMDHDQQTTVKVTVDLDENFPWYSAEMEIEFVVSDGSYENYIRTAIPVRLPSTNNHQTALPPQGLTYSHVGLAGDRTVYASTTFSGAPVIVRTAVGANANLFPAPFVPNDIAAITGSRVVMVGERNNVATISSSSTGGSQWSNTTVSGIFDDVAGIHMYNSNEGIAVGTGSGSQFGVARTADGGASWTQVNTAPPQNAGEQVVAGATYFNEEGVWFATTNNRIIYSTNKGQTWAQGRLNVNGARIISLAFKDNVNGVMLYRTSSNENAPVLGASSVNAGAAWTANAFNPQSLGITGLEVSSPGGHHLLIGTGGEVFGSDNNGTDWQVVLSRENGGVLSTDIRNLTQPSLLLGGEGVGLLAYRYSGPNGTKILDISESTVNYDTIDAGKSRQRWVEVSSTGESDVIIDSVVVQQLGDTPDSAYRVTVDIDQIIAPGTSDNLGIRLYTTTPGEYRGRVTIYSNATPPTVQADLIGYAIEVVSVDEDEVFVGGFTIAPNPASDVVNLTLPVPAAVNIVDMNGAVVISLGGVDAGAQVIDIKTLSAGAYSIVITQGSSIHSIPLRVIR